ncbi:hypothetical protein [Kitasatospora kifunensis]|uniref:Uncharacterized protein n=1 Tax=Kitasatospora kifunensis TaxID=58351 RepID=A0A7W7VUA6_KITKI|nr:hypothetical protein [Kitasatospora kifunensis]MBB4923131.1 hypothetical protein [Kitasatospora kifunensis]
MNEARAERLRATIAARVARQEQAVRDLISPWLQPQERVRGSMDVQVDWLTPLRAPRRLRATKPVPPDGWDASAFDRVLRIVHHALLGWFLGLRRVVWSYPHGRPFTGGWSSQAGLFLLMVRTGPSRHRYYENDDAFLVFTDRRLLVLHRESGERLGELALHHLVVGEPKEREFRQAERVDLSFTDGSLLALTMGSSETKELRDLLAGRA